MASGNREVSGTVNRHRHEPRVLRGGRGLSLTGGVSGLRGKLELRLVPEERRARLGVTSWHQQRLSNDACRLLREVRQAVVDESQVGWQQPDRDDRQPACRLGTQLPLAISRGPSLRCAATKQPRLARPYLRPLGGHPFVEVERESKSVRGSRTSRYCQGVSGRAERAASAEELPLLPSTLAPERASPDHDRFARWRPSSGCDQRPLSERGRRR
jgi:hypothetical protein